MKILFCSANCLMDPSSGAAISVRTLLQLLSKSGATTAAFTAACFDRSISNTDTEELKTRGFNPPESQTGTQAWDVSFESVEHFAVPMGTTRRSQLTGQLELTLLERALTFIDEYQPDVVISYGAGVFEQKLRSALQEKSIANVFYLANPNYKKMSAFQFADQVFTDTKATGDLYRERGLDNFTIGKFITRPKTSAPESRKKYITFVNPAPEKGVTLFYRIMELAQEIIPNEKFLVVESRGTLDKAEQRAGLPFSNFKSLTRLGLQKDMSDVFSMTKILLMPSVWHESGARTAIEASGIGIPTIATDYGGIPEILGDGGILIPPPPPLLENHWVVPPISTAIPWVQAIHTLVNDESVYALHRQAALACWSRHDPAKRIEIIKEKMNELILIKRHE